MKGSRGFTLLEITITLAILGIVLIIVYGVFARTLAGKEYAEGRADETAAVRGTFARLERDLQNTIARGPASPSPTPRPGAAPAPAPQGSLFLSRNHIDGSLPYDDIAFSAFVRRPAALALSAADTAIVHYFVVPDPADPGRRALLREVVFSLSGQSFDPEASNPASTSMILGGISSLEFRFFDGRGWIEEWDSTDLRNYAPLPQAVEISLGTWSQKGGAETFRIALDIPMARANPMAPKADHPPAQPSPSPEKQ